jgi:2-methylisocitrate lyase-like PEP mutase family enzyme
VTTHQVSTRPGIVCDASTVVADVAAKRAAFLDLHRAGCFVLPNAWDAGSAVRLAARGFPALASTSSGLAWSLGREDGEVALDELLEHLWMLNDVTDLPVNADFEAGFADDPDGVARNVLLAAATGVAGLSIEDRTGSELYPLPLAVERIRAAADALQTSSPDVLLVGRSEGYLIGDRDVTRTIERLVAYAEAGADCLYAPGVTDAEEIALIVAAVAPKPVNVLLMPAQLRVPELAELGVRRVSLGGGLARAAWTGFDQAVDLLLAEGAVPARS